MAERKKLAIIDGKSVFYRGYYAMPNLSTADGTPTGGVYGFSAMALEMIKRLKPDYVCVAWDKPKTNIRKRLELYPQYKAGRKPPPADFYAQIPILHELLDAFGWPLYELDDYEADDIMGALAVQAKAQDIETMLITSDLDALQLVNSHTKVYALKKGLSNIEEYHPASFEEKYGLKPEQFLDLKSLAGDSSDNIPGVPGVGQKTAIELLKQYKTLDEIYENTGLMKDTLRKKLEAGKDSAYLSKKLAQIWIDAPVKLDLEAKDIHKLDVDHLRKILQRLEFRSLLRNLPEHMRVESEQSTVDSLQLEHHDLEIKKQQMITNEKDMELLDFGDEKNLYIHGRCAGRHGLNPQSLVIGAASKVYVLDLTQLDHKKVADLLSKQIKGNKLIGYDVKSSLKILDELGVEMPQVEHDVQIGAFLINALVRSQSFTDLAIQELQYEGTAFEDLPTEDFLARGAEFIAVVDKIYSHQLKQLEKLPTVDKLAKEVEWPIIPVLADMERAGIKLDVKYLDKFAKQLEESISGYEQMIYGHADHEFNISSPSQLAEVLFEKLNLPTQFIKKGKTGYSTAASELDKLRGTHPIIDLITQYREATKLKNTYVDALPKLVDTNSRVHTTFNLTIAQTGRLSSIDPNLQNIPVRTDLGKHVRTAFVADKGNVLVSADYSQFELRLASVLADDKDMQDVFNSGVDIHAQTAADVNGIDVKDVTKQQRYEAKAVNFGILYGQGPHGLAQGTGMSFVDARNFIAKYFEVRPKLKAYIEATRKQASDQGYVETLLGRRRPTPDTHSSNFAVREAAFRAAVNMPIQGTAADLTKLAMIHVQQKLDKLTADSKQPTARPRMLLQVHDSILVECADRDAKKVGEILKETMENVYKLPVKIVADISIGKNWGEL